MPHLVTLVEPPVWQCTPESRERKVNTLSVLIRGESPDHLDAFTELRNDILELSQFWLDEYLTEPFRIPELAQFFLNSFNGGDPFYER